MFTLNGLHRCSEGCSLNIEQCSRAGGDVGADLLRVQVVVDQAVDDGRQLGLNQGVAGGLGEASVRIKQPVRVFSDSN